MIISLNNTENAFLLLLKATIAGGGAVPAFPVLRKGEWEGVLVLAEKHGLIAVSFGGYNIIEAHLNADQKIDIDNLMEWLGQASYRESVYKEKKESAELFAKAVAERGGRCIVMKGIGVSTYYPKPEWREFGDFDCFIIKDGKPAFELGQEVAESLGAKITTEGSYKHAQINYRDLLIENHKYISNFDKTENGERIERLLQKYILDGNYGTIEDSVILKPGAHFMALHLLRHSLDDFLNEGLLMRQVYDWTVFLKAEMAHLDWKVLCKDLEVCRLMRFCEVLTFIGMKYLGLEMPQGLVSVSDCSDLAEKVLLDTLSWNSTFGTSETVGQKVKRIFWTRFRRMWKFRELATESYTKLLWKTIAFSSYMHRKPEMD